MGLLYFEVEADYQELIELRKQIAGLEKQMAEVGVQGAAALKPLEQKFAELSARIEHLTNAAAVSGQKIQAAYKQMGSISTGIVQTTQKTTQNVGKVGKAMAEGVMDADNAANIFNDTIGGVNQGLGRLLNMMNGLGPAVGTAFGVGAIGMFINKVQEVRTYFQDIESSMRVFLGDAEKANEFTSQLKSYAYYNMFEFSDLAGGAKQLIAYGNETEKIIPIMDRLSNVAAGTGTSLGELIGLYNKAKSMGQVMSRDVQSWAAKGVVLRDELKAMGVEASTGAITFNQLNQVLEKVTGEGGRFHNLMAEQMNNLSAAKGQFQDNLDAMYNEIGEKLQPLLKRSIDMASWLVENYEAVGKTLLSLASAYGIYRTVLGVINVLERKQAAALKAVELVQNGEARSIAEATRMINEDTKARVANTASIKAQIEEKQKSMAMALAESRGEATNLRRRIKELDNQIKAMDIKRPELQKDAEKIGNIGAKKKLEDLETRYNITLAKQDEVKKKLKETNKIIKIQTDQLNESQKGLNDTMNESVKLTDLFSGATDKLKARFAPLGKVLSNPYFVLTAAITSCLVAVYALAKAQMTYADKAYAKEKEEIEGYNDALDRRIERSNEFIKVLKDENKSLYEQEKAYKRLIALNPALKEKTLYDVRDMSSEELQRAVDEKARIERGEHLNKVIQETTERIKKLEEEYEKAQVIISPTGGVMDTGAQIGRDLDRANARLKAYKEAYLEYQKSVRDIEFKNMTHEERNDVLTKERDQAQKRLEVMNDLYAKFAEIRNKAAEDENADREELQKEYLKQVNEQIQNAEGPLKQELEALRDKLQDKLFQNPLMFAFGDLDLSRVSNSDLVKTFTELTGKAQAESVKKGTLKNIRKAVNEMNKEISKVMNDTSLGDTERADQIGKLYDSYISKIEEYSVNEDKMAQEAILAYTEELRSVQEDRMDMFKNGGAAGLIKKSSEDSEKQLRQAEQLLREENKNYGNYADRLESATANYEAAKTTFKAIYDKMVSGEVINDNDFKNAKEELETSRKNYEELLKEGQRYDAFLSSSRKRQMQLNREKEDQEFSTREYELKAMRDGAEKAVGQVKLEFEKRQNAIERGYEDIREKRLEEAKKTWEENPDNVKNAFSEKDFLATYESKYADDIAKDNEQRAAQTEANVTDFLRKLNDLSKNLQTEEEKKNEQRRKAEEDILAIEQSIAEIEATMGENATEESEEMLANMRKRLELAKEIAKQLGYDQDKADFYKQYGTARQKTNAITQDYANQIAMARAQGKGDFAVRSLEYKRDSEINKAILDELKSEVDWAGALNSFGGIMSDYAKRVYEKAKKLIDSPEFSKLSGDEQKSILDMFAQIRDNITEKVDFGSLGDKMTKYEEALEHYNDVYENNIKVIESSTASEKDKEAAERLIAEAQAEVVKTQHDATYAINETVASIDLFRSGLEQLASGSLSGVYTGIQALGEALGKTPSKWGQIIAAILKLIDLLADKGIGPIINGILEAIEKVFDKLLDDITSGRFLEQVIDGLVKIIATLFKGLAKSVVNMLNPFNDMNGAGGKVFGRDDIKKRLDNWFDKTFYGGANAFEKLSEETYKLSDALDTASDIILEDWNKKTAKEAAKSAAEAQANNAKQIEAFRKLGEQWGRTGAKWNSHSQGYKWWNDELNSDARKALSDMGVKGVEDLMNLSVDQYKDLQKNAAVWSQIDETLQEYISLIIKASDETEDLADKTAEKFLNLSFDDMASNFLSTMMDIKNTAYETADDIATIFYQSMVTDEFNQNFRGQLEKVYKKMQVARENGNLAEIEQLKKDYNAIVRDFQTKRDEIASDTGYAQSYAANQASQGGFNAMSSEAGNELNGRFAVLQIEGEQIRGMQEKQTNELIPSLTTKVDTLAKLIGGSENNPISNIISDVQNTLSKSLLELIGINENTAFIRELFDKNGYMRTQMDSIKVNMQTIKTNTDKIGKK